MKTLNNKLPSLLNLPVAWTDEDWAKPLIVQPEPRPCRRSMNPLRGLLAHSLSRRPRGRRAFTLIELLVVIAIIGILAALLLPVFGVVKKNAKIKAAKIDMSNIASAIAAYQAAYTVAPVKLLPPLEAGNDYSFSETNTDVIVVLMDVDAPGLANAGHKRNPEKHSFLNPGTLKAGTTSQGVSSTDYNFRDPWGNPYIIAFDLDYDNAVEVLDVPSGQNTTGNEYYNPYPYAKVHKPVLIWSKGPDGQAENGIPGPNRGQEPRNKDNVKSWE